MTPRARVTAVFAALALAAAGTTAANLPSVASASPPANAAASGPLPLVPQPVRAVRLHSAAVTVGANSTIAVHGDAATRSVAQMLTSRWRTATGESLSVATASTGRRATISLRQSASGALGSEGYHLRVADGAVSLTAHTAHGLFNALTTLLQLVPVASAQSGASSQLPAVDIVDHPRYHYRGLMLDVSRRFYPVKDVLRAIDEAAQYKIDVLHLHLNDDQGWRIAIDAIPSLTKVGASTQVGLTGGPWYYTAAQYRHIVAYARARFMTVVPEIDGPGHSNAEQASVAGLNCDNHRVPAYSGFGGQFSLQCLSDPAHVAQVSKFLTTVMTTLASMTPGRYIHVGGDETPTATAAEYRAYVRVVGKAVTGVGRLVMGWHNLAQGRLPAGSLMEYWGLQYDRDTVGTGHESDSIKAVRSGLAQGADFVMAPADHAYLDMQYNASTTYGLHWAGYTSVRHAYAWDPDTVTGKPNGRDAVVSGSRVAGVEGALWGDRAYRGSSRILQSPLQFVEPSVYADYMMFPRLPVLAEIAWSPRSTHSWASLRLRLAAQAPRWRAEGIGFYRAPGIPWR